MRTGRELVILAVLGCLVQGGHSSALCRQINCKQIWYDGHPRKEIVFYMYETSTNNDSTSTVHWQWTSNLNEKWTVYYKEWPRKETVTGGFVMLNKHVIIAQLNWKIRNGLLQWTTVYRRPFTATWNGTICNTGIPIKLESANSIWIFYLGSLSKFLPFFPTVTSSSRTSGGLAVNWRKGDVKFVGGKSGQKALDNTSILLNALTNGESLKRTIREAEDMEGKKETTWNKIKGWFKELFDQSDNDQRGWLTRLSDWFLGFLERTLS